MTIDELLAQIAQLQAQLQTLQAEQTTTGPGTNIKGSQPIGVAPLWEQIKEDKDPKAIALLELKKEISDQITSLKKEGEKFRSDINDHQKGLRKTDLFLVTITIVVVVAFITTLSLVFFDLIKEKDIYLKYDDAYKNYSDQNSESKIQINNLKNEIQLLKAKNPFLK